MGQPLFSERQKSRYRVRVTVGILIAIWATGILGIGLYIKCCSYKEDNWVTNLQTPIWTGGILLTTGLLFLCSNVRPRKSAGQMLDVIVILVLILTVLSEVVFIYNFLSFHSETLEDQNRVIKFNTDTTQNNFNTAQNNLNTAHNNNHHEVLKTNQNIDFKKYHIENNKSFTTHANYMKIWEKMKKLYKKIHDKNGKKISGADNIQKDSNNEDDDDDDDDGDETYKKIQLTRNLYLCLIVLTGIEIIFLSSILLRWSYKEKTSRASSKNQKADHGPLLDHNNRDSKENDSYKTFKQGSFQSPNYGTSADQPPSYNDIYTRVTESSFV